MPCRTSCLKNKWMYKTACGTESVKFTLIQQQTSARARKQRCSSQQWMPSSVGFTVFSYKKKRTNRKCNSCSLLSERKGQLNLNCAYSVVDKILNAFTSLFKQEWYLIFLWLLFKHELEISYCDPKSLTEKIVLTPKIV